jgi:hypothetical protein
VSQDASALLFVLSRWSPTLPRDGSSIFEDDIETRPAPWRILVDCGWSAGVKGGVVRHTLNRGGEASLRVPPNRPANRTFTRHSCKRRSRVARIQRIERSETSQPQNRGGEATEKRSREAGCATRLGAPKGKARENSGKEGKTREKKGKEGGNSATLRLSIAIRTTKVRVELC